MNNQITTVQYIYVYYENDALRWRLGTDGPWVMVNGSQMSVGGKAVLCGHDATQAITYALDGQTLKTLPGDLPGGLESKEITIHISAQKSSAKGWISTGYVEPTGADACDDFRLPSA